MKNTLMNSQNMLTGQDSQSIGTPSAVVVLVVEGRLGVNKILVIRRPKRMKAYPGDWCFPGGRWEPGDSSLVDTAWRELEEETAIPQQACHSLQSMDDFFSGKGDLVRPFLVRITQAQFDHYFKACKEEVACSALIELDRLDEMNTGSPAGKTSTRDPSYFFTFTHDNACENVWGLSASILVHFHNVRRGLAKPVDYGERYLDRKEANCEHH
ncbi:MAG: NUDIX hydrolase [Oleiphilus sp.]